MYGETFYGRHTAQHQLQWSQIKIAFPFKQYMFNSKDSNKELQSYVPWCQYNPQYIHKTHLTMLDVIRYLTIRLYK